MYFVFLTPIQNPEKFAQVIHKQYPNVYTVQEIIGLLTCKEFKGLAIFDNGILVAYLLGRYKNIDSNRYVYEISYIHVEYYYNQTVGKALFTNCLDFANNDGAIGVILSCKNDMLKTYKKYLRN